MKLFALLALTFSAFAADDFILLKSSGGGMIIQEYARSQSCKLYKAQGESEYTMVVEEQYGPARTKERIKLTITGLNELISNSANEPLARRPNYLCDAPETTYIAVSNNERVELFQSGGCGAPRLDRNGPFSGHIKAILDRYCPITHDYGN